MRCHGGPRDNLSVEEGIPESGHGASLRDSLYEGAGNAGISHDVYHDPCVVVNTSQTTLSLHGILCVEEDSAGISHGPCVGEGIPSLHDTPCVGGDTAGLSHGDRLHGSSASRDVFLRDNPCVEEGTPERGHGASPCDSPCVEVGSAGIPRGVHHDPCEEGGIPSPHGTPHVGVDNAGRSHDCLHDNWEVLEAFLHCNLGALEVCRRDTKEVLEVCRHGRMAVLEGHIQV